MMNYFLITLFVFSANPNPQERTQEAIEESKLLLLGGGFEDRSTGNIITLACVGKSSQPCSKIRHVLFEAETHEAQFIGDSIQIVSEHPGVSNDKATQKTLKKISKNYHRYKLNNRSQVRVIGRAFLYFVIPIGVVAGGMVAFPVILSSAALSQLGVLAAVTTPVLVLTNTSDSQALSRSHLVTALKDQNGWNWVAKTKKVNHKNFNLYHQGVQAGAINGVIRY